MVSFDDVLPTLVGACENWAGVGDVEKICVVRDLEGRVRVAMRPRSAASLDVAAIEGLLQGALHSWFAKPLVLTSDEREKGRLAQAFVEQAVPWNDATYRDPTGALVNAPTNRWMKLERRLAKLDWVSEHRTTPAWPLEERAPAIVTFYSFKGGVGRTTLLLACALLLARKQKRVALIDLDLEAPGLGPILGAAGERGVLDYIVDYIATGQGRTNVLPVQGFGATEGAMVDVLSAGRIGFDYLEKLSRLDYSAVGGFLSDADPPVAKALRGLLMSLRGKGYDYILLDARAGLHDLAGLSLHGLAHLDVLVGRATEQGYLGLDLTVAALARRRSVENLMAIVVHSMVPADEKEAALEKQRFQKRCYELFKHHVYDPLFDDDDIPSPDDDDSLHTAFPISRHPRLETFDAVSSIVDQLGSSEYAAVVDRIVELCTPETSEGAP
jgi:MinD-like ATPase involved in chromosome partitioning or flagellar assembly